jgi:hypothetical protein
VTCQRTHTKNGRCAHYLLRNKPISPFGLQADLPAAPLPRTATACLWPAYRLHLHLHMAGCWVGVGELETRETRKELLRAPRWQCRAPQATRSKKQEARSRCKPRRSGAPSSSLLPPSFISAFLRPFLFPLSVFFNLQAPSMRAASSCQQCAAAAAAAGRTPWRSVRRAGDRRRRRRGKRRSRNNPPARGGARGAVRCILHAALCTTRCCISCYMRGIGLTSRANRGMWHATCATCDVRGSAAVVPGVMYNKALIAGGNGAAKTRVTASKHSTQRKAQAQGGESEGECSAVL